MLKQGVTLTGRNTTGPLRAARGKLRCAVECYRRRQTTTTDDDRPTESKTILAPDTTCRRASNESKTVITKIMKKRYDI